MRTKVKCKGIAMMLTLCMMVSTMPLSGVRVSASEGIAIDANNFPDANFQAKIKEKLDKDSDGYLSDAERTVTYLSLENCGIKDLTGINNINITTTLNVGNNELTSLKYENVNVQNIYCPNNKISEIDVSGCPNLSSFEVSNNQLEQLNVKVNTKLTTLLSEKNQLSSIDVTNNTELAQFWVSDNPIQSLDVSKNTNLYELLCRNCGLSELSVTDLTGLTTLYCGANQIKTIDTSKNTKLDQLDVSYMTSLEGLDISKNVDLTYLNCSYCDLNSLDISKNLNLSTCYANYNNFTTFEIPTGLKSVDKLYINNNHLTSLIVPEDVISKLARDGQTYDINVKCDGTYDLTQLPKGFDVAKTSNWENGTVDGNILTVGDEAKVVTYQYSCGHGWSMKGTTLNINKANHKESDWIIDSYATTEQVGHRHTVCTECGVTIQDEDIPKLDDPNNGLVNKDTVVEEGAPETAFNNEVKELRENILTEEETKRVTAGESAKIYLEIKDASNLVTTEEKKVAEEKVNQVLEGETKLQYVDISLFKKVGSDEAQKVTSAACPISVTIKIPESIRATGREYKIVRVHNGVAEIINGTYNATTGDFTFETKEFSTYAIAYADIANNITTQPTTQTTTPTVKKELSLLLAKGKEVKKNIKLTWLKEKKATGYEVYWSYCNGKSNYKKMASTKKLSYTVKKFKKNKAYKYYIKSYKIVNGKKVYISKSPNIHVAMSNTKLTNISSISVKSSKVTLKVKKTSTIKASSKKMDKKKKLLLHVAKYRYYTTNKSVATVSSKGKITAKKKGSCKIYVIANNGVYKKVAVTVK